MTLVREVPTPPDLGAMAQSTLVTAMGRAGLSRAELARRLGMKSASGITRLLSGHNLTLKTLARALHVCGFEIKLSIQERDHDHDRLAPRGV